MQVDKSLLHAVKLDRMCSENVTQKVYDTKEMKAAENVTQGGTNTASVTHIKC